jgi:hypothetical protein
LGGGLGGHFWVLGGAPPPPPPPATFRRQSISPSCLSFAPAPCWHNDLRRCRVSVTSHAPCMWHNSPYHRRCNHQPALPLQVHSSRQDNSRSVSSAASHRQNGWSGVVRVYAITVMSPLSVVISDSSCSTLSRTTTRKTTPLQTSRFTNGEQHGDLHHDQG